MKCNFFILISLILSSCAAQKKQKSSEWQKTGKATVDNELEVVLGTTYTILDTKEIGEIHLTHKDLNSMEVQKVATGHFTASFHKAKNSKINITDLKSKSHSITADFEVRVRGESIGNHNMKIVLDKNITPPSNQITRIRTYILPVIHDFMAKFLFKFQDNNCLDKAIKACGKAKVKTLDVSIFASSCAFECD